MGIFREQQEQWEQKNLFKLAKKSRMAKRWKEEKPDPYRTEFQKDVGRILYSNPFRRLRMKTQVFSASGIDQHNRTRLTHSLEVAMIARSIARPLMLNEDLVEAIALGHDLGHTPYGHAGEKALNKCLEGISTFHHNVQSVWILRTTLCNRKDENGKKFQGFNLTHNVVEGIWKHTDFKDTTNELEYLKHYYPDNPSSLEGQTVDIADGIAYLKHDVEDGKRNKLLTDSELEELWKNNTDIKFEHWNHHLIYDVIGYSRNENKIDFSPKVKELYRKIKELVFEKVINSKAVKQRDEEGIQKILAIYNYCYEKPDYVIKKHPSRNKYLHKKHGIERVIVDFIQWLGDENANMIYENIDKRKSFEIPDGEYYSEFYE